MSNLKSSVLIAAMMTVASIASGCSILGKQPLIVAESDCNLSRSLERDLSVAAIYEGTKQIYLNEEGESCSFK